jgi:hypothetical protein
MIALVAVAFWLFVDIIPPRSVTHMHMLTMKRRILRYAAANDSLPTSLEQLPILEGYTNEVTDGWGRPILWQVEGTKVTLTSYGRDGVPGGSGEDADMVGVFQAKTADGHWAKEMCEWEVDPYGKRPKAAPDAPELRGR